MTKKLQNIVLLLLLLLGVILTYSNHFSNPFEFDDSHQIVDNIYIRHLDNITSFFKDASTSSSLDTHQTYRPITMASLAIDYRLGNGLNPFYFHLSTFIWFLVQLVILFFLFRQILFKVTQHKWSDYIAIFIVALYGLHPALAETINYIYQRGDSLSTLFVVAAFYIYITFPEKRNKYLYLIPALIGILAKEPATMFAPILFFYVLLFETKNSLYDIFTKKGWSVILTVLRQTLPAFIVCGLAGILVIKMQSSAFETGGSSRLNYLITQPWVLFHYFFTFFIPTNLSADTDLPAFSNLFEERIYAGLAFVFALLVVAIKTSQKEETKPIAFGILWFFIALIPTSSLVPLAEVTNDHRMFFPFVGLALSVGWTIGIFIIKRESKIDSNPLYKYGIIAVGFIILTAFSAGTVQRNKVWHSAESLWYDVTVKSPTNGRGLMNYGLTQMELAKYDVALDYYTRALVYAPYYSNLFINLAIVNNALNKTDEAQVYYRKAIQYSPKHHTVYYYYAKFLLEKGRIEEAKTNGEIALSLSKADMNTRHLLMEIYLRSNEGVKLDDLIKDTQTIVPNDPIINALLLAAKNKPLTAAQPQTQSIDKNQVLNNAINLSLDYFNQKQFEKCIAAAQKALEIDPTNKLAYNNIGCAFKELKEWTKAIDAFNKALQIDPAFERARRNLELTNQLRSKKAN